MAARDSGDFRSSPSPPAEAPRRARLQGAGSAADHFCTTSVGPGAAYDGCRWCAQRLASFAPSNTSALTLRNVGRGAAFACSFLPSFAFLHPALPAKPLDTCPRIDCYSQFFPSAFDMVAHSLIHLPDTMRGGRLPSLTAAQAKQAAGHAASSDPLVEAVVLTPSGGDAGALVLLVNWQMQPASALTITVERRALHGCAQTS